jgi:hypothetical protein
MSDLSAELDEPTGLVTLKRDGAVTHIMPLSLYEDLRQWSPDTGNRMALNEFVDEGYLHELNRQFLHPLGLALEVICDDVTGEVHRFGGIHDYREDPEGMTFGEDTLDVDKVKRIAAITEARKAGREAGLGYWVQPLSGDSNG